MKCSTTTRKTAGVILAAGLAAAGSLGVAHAQTAPGAATAVKKAPATDIPVITSVTSNIIDRANASSAVLSLTGTNLGEWNTAGTSVVKPVVQVGGVHIEQSNVLVVSGSRIVVKLPVATAHRWSGEDGRDGGAHPGAAPAALTAQGESETDEDYATRSAAHAATVAVHDAAVAAWVAAGGEDDVEGETLSVGTNQDVTVTNSIGSNLDSAADDVHVVDTAVRSNMRLVSSTNAVLSGPVLGSTLGGASVSLVAPTAYKLQKATKVTVGGVTATILKRTTYRGDINFATAGVQPGVLDKLTIKIPPHAASESVTGESIVVATPGALQTLTNAYRYEAGIASASASLGQTGDVIVLKGTGFTGATFKLNNVASPVAHVISDTEAVVTVPADASNVALAPGFTGVWSVLANSNSTASTVSFKVPEVVEAAE